MTTNPDPGLRVGYEFTEAQKELIAALLTEFKAGMDLGEIQAEYRDTLYAAMSDYLQSSSPITRFRNAFRRAVNDAFTLAFIAGWAEAGAGELTGEAQNRINELIEAEIQFADALFVQLKALRDNPDLTMEEKLQAAEDHAEGYTHTLNGVYAEGRMMGEPHRMGRWVIGSTKEHCSTCVGLNGKEHPLSWYLKNGYIPQEAGSGTLECGGWECRCKIVDAKTGEQLIP